MSMNCLANADRPPLPVQEECAGIPVVKCVFMPQQTLQTCSEWVG